MRASEMDWANFDPGLLPLFEAEDDCGVVKAAVSQALRSLKIVIKDANLDQGGIADSSISFDAAVSKVFADDQTIPQGLRPLKPVFTAISSVSEVFDRDRSARFASEPAASDLVRLKSAVSEMTRAGGFGQEVEEADPRKAFALGCMLVSLMMLTAAKLYRGLA